jgi:hypothetical protein
MTDEARTNETGKKPPRALRSNVFQFPAVVAIGLYLVVLALVNIVGVAGGQIRPVYLVFSAIFFAVALGLLLMLRWAWSLALAAVVFLMGLFFWRFYTQHETPFVFQGVLNLVFFLYLVRPEVREKLR